MTKFASLKKIHTKIITVKRNLELNDLGFLYYLANKHALTCPGLYRLIFQALYHTALTLPKREINEIINFRNFRKLFINNYAAVFRYFGTLFPNGKNETKLQGVSNK